MCVWRSGHSLTHTRTHTHAYTHTHSGAPPANLFSGKAADAKGYGENSPARVLLGVGEKYVCVCVCL